MRSMERPARAHTHRRRPKLGDREGRARGGPLHSPVQLVHTVRPEVGPQDVRHHGALREDEHPGRLLVEAVDVPEPAHAQGPGGERDSGDVRAVSGREGRAGERGVSSERGVCSERGRCSATGGAGRGAHVVGFPSRRARNSSRAETALYGSDGVGADARPASERTSGGAGVEVLRE